MFKISNLRNDSPMLLTVTKDNLVEDKQTGKQVPCNAQRASSPVKWLDKETETVEHVSLGGGILTLTGKFLTANIDGETVGYFGGAFSPTELLASPFAILSGNQWEFIDRTEETLNWKVIRDAFVSAYPDKNTKMTTPEPATLPITYVTSDVLVNITMAIAMYGKSGLLRYMDTATPKPPQLSDDVTLPEGNVWSYRMDANGISVGYASGNKTGKVTYTASVRLADIATKPDDESTDDKEGADDK